MLFDTLAMTAGRPNASSVGKVISDPEPTTALIPPAATAAAKIASASAAPTRSSHGHDRRTVSAGCSGERGGAGGPPGAGLLDEQRQPEALGQVPGGEDLLHQAGGKHRALSQQQRVGEARRHLLHVMRIGRA